MPAEPSPARPGFASWPPRLLAVLAGMAAAFAHPPWGFLPGLLGYAVMFRLIDGAPSRDAPLRGWLAGCGYFLVSTFWIYEPFQVDAAQQGWMAPIAVALMTGLMALFWGLAAALYRAIRGTGDLRVLVFAASLALLEWARGRLFTGFPWNLPGETWRAGTAMSQAASVVGAYGLTWLTLALTSAPGLGRRWRALCLAALAGLGLWGFGLIRLGLSLPPRAGAPMIRVVQADIPQDSKYDLAKFTGILDRYLALTALPAGRTPDIVVWPEGAIPAATQDYLAPGSWTRAAVARSLKPGQTLLLGGYHFGRDARGGPITFNGFLALRRSFSDLQPLRVYDKYRLVPFGEYMPLDGLATRLGIKAMTHVGDGFTPGPLPRPMSLGALPAVQPLICYESLYPGFTRQGASISGRRAGWIANISNDAWFGSVSGPAQNLNLASYRAIEEGLPMVRSTPTGVSAVIDAFGRPVRRLEQGAYGVIDTPLPAAFRPTLFDRWGDAPFWLMLLISLRGARRSGRGT